MGTRIFKIEGELSEIIDPKVESWQPPKLRNQKICQFEPTLKSDLFFWDKISDFFFIPVVQEYLNEISPTLNSPNKLKTSGKPQRIADLQHPASGQDKPDTL